MYQIAVYDQYFCTKLASILKDFCRSKHFIFQNEYESYFRNERERQMYNMKIK